MDGVDLKLEEGIVATVLIVISNGAGAIFRGAESGRGISSCDSMT